MGISHNYLYDQVEVFSNEGTFTWTQPSNIDDSKPVLVHVWGAGGTGSDYYSYTSMGADPAACGGGGGGLAVKEIDVSALGATETITVGQGKQLPDVVGGTSSFGSHCSATGGNGGAYNTQNESGKFQNDTAISPIIANPVAGTATDLGGRQVAIANGYAGNGQAYWGQGGMGIGGDINRRGGWGGVGYYASSDNNGGGGGGSAPAPYGWSHGYDGGRGYTYAGGGGGGIGQVGWGGDYAGGCGGGSSNQLQRPNQGVTHYYAPSNGGGALAGTAGSGGKSMMVYSTYGGDSAYKTYSGDGLALIEPNQIFFGGGGGGGICDYAFSSNINYSYPSNGGPGGGGGGAGNVNNGIYFYNIGGNGGILGGGGGAYQYSHGGHGGNAGGGGAAGYYAGANTPTDDRGGASSASYMWYGAGGNGLVILQYATK